MVPLSKIARGTPVLGDPFLEWYVVFKAKAILVQFLRILEGTKLFFFCTSEGKTIRTVFFSQRINAEINRTFVLVVPFRSRGRVISLFRKPAGRGVGISTVNFVTDSNRNR